MKYRYVIKDLDTFEHTFEVDDEAWATYTSAQREHVFLQEKRRAVMDFKSQAYDFLVVEGIVEDIDEDQEPEHNHQD